MEKLNQIKQYADTLRLTKLRNKTESIIHQAQIDKPSYLEFVHELLKSEVLQRQKTDYERRLKLAHLPAGHGHGAGQFRGHGHAHQERVS